MVSRAAQGPTPGVDFVWPMLADGTPDTMTVTMSHRQRAATFAIQLIDDDAYEVRWSRITHNTVMRASDTLPSVISRLCPKLSG